MVGVPFGKEGGSVFLFRDERAYESTDLASLKLVARQLSHAKERSRLRAALEHRDLEAIQALSSALRVPGRHHRGAHRPHPASRRVRDARARLRARGGPRRPLRGHLARYRQDRGPGPHPEQARPPFSEEEWEIMRRHPEIGANILSSIAGFERISEAVLTHHEHFDGGRLSQGPHRESGYRWRPGSSRRWTPTTP